MSKPVEDGCVEIFAGQIFDLACAKIPSWYNEGGIAVHGTTDTRVHLHLQNSSFITEGCTDSGYTPRHAPQASVFSARLRLDYENFDAPVVTGLLRVTIGGKTDSISILMATPYAKRQSRFGTVSICVGGQNRYNKHTHGYPLSKTAEPFWNCVDKRWGALLIP